jgi:3-phenylpropionate/cinnamic acid dioxygenase small subunit
MDDVRLQDIIDRQAVTDVVVRYATGIDMRDWSLYRSCFADEVYIDFTSWSGGEPQRMTADRWVVSVRSGLAGFDATQHISTNHVITLHGDDAVCVSYVQAQHVLRDVLDADGDSTFTLGGYYQNDLVRTSDGWKIRRCRLTVMWTTGDRHLFALARERVAEKDEKH